MKYLTKCKYCHRLLGICSRKFKNSTDTLLILDLTIGNSSYQYHIYGHRHDAARWDGGSKPRKISLYPKGHV